MNVFSLSSLLIVIFNVPLAIIVFFKGKKRDVSKALSFFILLVAIWGLGTFKYTSTVNITEALFWRKIANITVIFAPVAYYHLTYTFLKLRENYQKPMLVFAYSFGILCLILNFFFPQRYFVGELNWIFNRFYYINWWVYKSPINLTLYISFYWLLLFYTFTVLLLSYRSATGLFRTQLKYFILGAIIAWLGPITLWLMEFKIYLYPYSNFLILICPTIWAYAILRYRLIDIRVAITRISLFIVVYSAVLGIPLFLGIYYNYWSAATFIAVALASAGPFIFNHLRQRAEQMLFRQQYQYQKELERFSHSFVHIPNLTELLDSTLYEIESFVSISFCAIYLKKGPEYRLQSTSLPEASLPLDIPETSIFVTAFNKSPQPMWAEQLPISPCTEPLSLVCPLYTHQGLVGFILLGEKTAGRILDETDKSVFHTLANNLSLALSKFTK